jgi:RNA polymerase sigma factor (sigma-70 family)
MSPIAGSPGRGRRCCGLAWQSCTGWWTAHHLSRRLSPAGSAVANPRNCVGSHWNGRAARGRRRANSLLTPSAPFDPYRGMPGSAEVSELAIGFPADDTRAAEVRAFEAELIPLLGPAHRLARGMLCDAGLAEDAVQEASLRAWARRRNRRPGTDLGPWFLAIVANRCRESRRSHWSRVLRLPEPRGARGADDGDPAEGMDVRRALRCLPERARLAVILRFYLDLPFTEVAAVLGCSENAAKVRVSRATAALRAQLGVRR